MEQTNQLKIPLTPQEPLILLQASLKLKKTFLSLEDSKTQQKRSCPPVHEQGLTGEATWVYSMSKQF